MAFDRFLIADIKSGLQTDIKPFLIPDDAFENLENAYCWRGRVRKRVGSVPINFDSYGTALSAYMSRLSYQCPTMTDGAGNVTTTFPTNAVAVGQQLIAIDITNPGAGYEIFTITALGNPGTLSHTGNSTASTIVTTTNPGTITIAGTIPNALLFYYPGLPVMGFVTFEQGLGQSNPLIAFDTKFSYEWNFATLTWDQYGTYTWNGSDSNFFSTTIYLGSLGVPILFATNTLQITYIAAGAPNWTLFQPITATAANNSVSTCKYVFAFKNRLLLLNTTELVNNVSTVFKNRIRFSAAGISPLDANAFNFNVYGNAGYVTLDTSEEINNAGFLNDRFLVTTANNYYEIVWTGNEAEPFRVQRINSELGNASPFSLVQFDKVILNIGPRGIQACSANGVQRIDDKIPEDIFISELNGGDLSRIYGARDYASELVFWTFPEQGANVGMISSYPTRILVYNYKTGSWAFFDDKISCFGYYTGAITSNANLPNPPEERVIYGTLQGFVNMFDRDAYSNAYSIQISNVTYVGNMATITVPTFSNILNGDYIYIQDVYDATLGNTINSTIYQVSNVTGNTFTITQAAGATPFAGAYTGGGLISLISQIDILTKQYNLYQKQARNIYLERVDFLVDKTFSGQITIDQYISTTQLSLLEASAATGTQICNGILETSPYPDVPLEAYQAQLWHPIYMQSEGQYVQLHIYLTPAQMLDLSVFEQDFQMHAMMLYAMPTTQGFR